MQFADCSPGVHCNRQSKVSRRHQRLASRLPRAECCQNLKLVRTVAERDIRLILALSHTRCPPAADQMLEVELDDLA